MVPAAGPSAVPGGENGDSEQRATASLENRVGAVPSGGRGFADVVMDRPQILPEVEIAFREAKFAAGEMFFLFSRAEINKSAKPFRFSVVLKFLQRRPSRDHVRRFIKSRWGLRAMPVVGQLKNPQNILVRFTNEDDFFSVISRGNSEITGAPYRVFHWTPNFVEQRRLTAGSSMGVPSRFAIEFLS